MRFILPLVLALPLAAASATLDPRQGFINMLPEACKADCETMITAYGGCHSGDMGTCMSMCSKWSDVEACFACAVKNGMAQASADSSEARFKGMCDGGAGGGASGAPGASGGAGAAGASGASGAPTASGSASAAVHSTSKPAGSASSSAAPVASSATKPAGAGIKTTIAPLAALLPLAAYLL